jgi:hypothetical protein
MKISLYAIALLVSVASATHADPIPTNCIPVLSGLVSWWMASDNANDSVGANHGTLVGGMTFAPGKYGQAFNFDGVDDGVNVADSPSLQLTQSFTIEAWVYIRAYPVEPQSFWTIGSIVFRGDDRGGLDPYSLIVRGATRKLEFSVQSADNQLASIEGPVPAGEWVHVAATLDDATGAMKLYLNASVIASTNTPLRSLGPLDPASNPGWESATSRVRDARHFDFRLTACWTMCGFTTARCPNRKFTPFMPALNLRSGCASTPASHFPRPSAASSGSNIATR